MAASAAVERVSHMALSWIDNARINGVVDSQTMARISSMIESGSHYEAQQMLKSVYHRHKVGCMEVSMEVCNVSASQSKKLNQYQLFTMKAKKQLQDSYTILAVCGAVAGTQ